MLKLSKKDKRQFNRLYVYHLVKYKPFLDPAKQSAPVISMAKNISAGGLCLRTQEYFPVHTVLEIAIKFPSFEEPISTLAKVSWIRKRSKSDYYEIGVQFVDIEDSVRNVIARQIDFVLDKVKKDSARSITLHPTL